MKWLWLVVAEKTAKKRVNRQADEQTYFPLSKQRI